MVPRGIQKEDEKLPLATSPWESTDFEKLHKLVQHFETLEVVAEEYNRMQWLKRKAIAFFIWGLGVPTALLYFFDPLEKLLKIVQRLRGH